MGGAWTESIETRCQEAIATILRPSTTDQQVEAWRALITEIAPHIESWADSSWLLRRWRLRSEDSTRSILVDVLTRLRSKDYANLRRFHANAPARELTETTDEVEAIQMVCRLEQEVQATTPEDPRSYRFRAWLLTLHGFVTKDYIRQRLGWSQSSSQSKRDLGSHAARLSVAPDAGVRPPFTDYVHLRALLAKIQTFTDSFPAPMQVALRMWMNERSFQDIANSLQLESTKKAEALVRAAKGRLREEFRELDTTTDEHS